LTDAATGTDCTGQEIYCLVEQKMKIRVINLSDSLWLETLEKIRHDIYHLPDYLYLESVRYNAVAEAILIADDDKNEAMSFFTWEVVWEDRIKIVSIYSSLGFLNKGIFFLQCV
jgi:hypothetical protein